MASLEKCKALLLNKSTNPRTCFAGEAERPGYGCSRKVFDSGYIPSVPPQAAGVCTLCKQSKGFCSSACV
jgi:hypothetical protein